MLIQDSLLKQNTKNIENTRRLTQFKEQAQSLKFDTLIKDGIIIKSDEKKSDELVDTLANLRTIIEVDKELQDQFKNGDLNVNFEDTLLMVERLAKQEFTLKSKLLQITKA